MIEVGDLVQTDHGVKMVVDVYRAINPKEICLSCVEAQDDADVGDVWPSPMTYFATSVVKIYSPSRFGRD
jgi:hypothetical protein